MKVVYSVQVHVYKEEANEAQGDEWIPSTADVAEEIDMTFRGRNLETGWFIGWCSVHENQHPDIDPRVVV